MRKLILEKMNLDRAPETHLRFYITPFYGEEYWELLDLTQGDLNTYFDTAQKVRLPLFLEAQVFQVAIDIKDEMGNWLFEPRTVTTDDVATTM